MTSDQNLPICRSFLPFPHGRGMDTDAIRTLRRKKERKEGRLIVWATGSTCYTALLLNENA